MAARHVQLDLIISEGSLCVKGQLVVQGVEVDGGLKGLSGDHV